MKYRSIIEYLFYAVDRQYKKWGENDISHLYALCFVALIQTLNLLTVLIWSIILRFNKAGNISAYFFFISFLFLVLINYRIIYRKKTSKNNSFKHNAVNQEVIRYKLPSIIYAIASILIFSGSLIYYLSS